MQHAPTAAPRQARSVRNDERILDAAVRLADQEGWPGLLIARVAEASGLSRRTVSDRLPDRSDIGASVWRERLAAPVVSNLQAVLEAAGLLHAQVADPRKLARAMRPFVEPDESMRAAAELLVESCFDAGVRRAVHETLGETLEQWLSPVTRRVSQVGAAQRSVVIITALGVLLEARRQEGKTFQLQTEWDRLCAALAAPKSIEKLPDVHFEHWDGVFDFDTGDALLDRLLEATRDEIGRNGYESTTIDDIAKAAGRTKGLVFSRYPSKKQLFNDTVTRYAKAMYDLNEQAWIQMQQTASPGAAEAVLYREVMRPGRDHLRGFALEQYRLSWHDPDMRASIALAIRGVINERMTADPSRTRTEFQAAVFIGAAQGIGVLLLAAIYPDAWSLPYQHVTVPLNDHAS